MNNDMAQAQEREAILKRIAEWAASNPAEVYGDYRDECSADMIASLLISRHRSRLAAARALVRLITGTNPTARDYLRQVGQDVALRYLAWQIADSGRVERKLSVRELRESDV